MDGLTNGRRIDDADPEDCEPQTFSTTSDKGVDLAGGNLPPKQREDVSLATEAWNFQRSQQGSVFSIVSAMAVLLYMTAATFGVAAFYQTARGTSIDWHTWLIPVSFLLPPTILSVALIRAVYPKPSVKKESDSSLETIPAARLIKECAQLLKE